MDSVFSVSVLREGDWWSIRAVGGGAVVVTRSADLDQVESAAREAIAVALGVSPDSFGVDVRVEFPLAFVDQLDQLRLAAVARSWPVLPGPAVLPGLSGAQADLGAAVALDIAGRGVHQRYVDEASSECGVGVAVPVVGVELLVECLIVMAAGRGASEVVTSEMRIASVAGEYEIAIANALAFVDITALDPVSIEVYREFRATVSDPLVLALLPDVPDH